jgi:hypothetical protein
LNKYDSDFDFIVSTVAAMGKDPLWLDHVVVLARPSDDEVKALYPGIKWGGMDDGKKQDPAV